MRETFELMRGEMRRAGRGMLPAGHHPDRRRAQLAGMAELGREVLQMPVRVAAPAGIGGLVDTILTPAYATAVGLLQWGAATLAAASRCATSRRRRSAGSAGSGTRSGRSSPRGWPRGGRPLPSEATAARRRGCRSGPT